jgi:hypothetical protein
MDNKNKVEYPEKDQAHISAHRIAQLVGNSIHICRGFECQQEGKMNRPDKRD